MIRSPVAFLAAFVLVVAACGDADTTTTTAPPATEPPATTTTVPATTTTTAGPTTTTSSTTSTLPPGVVVDVYFATGDGSDCSQVDAFQRQIPESDDPVAAAFNELVGGPTPDEAAAGAGSFFSSVTADAIRSIELAGGLLTVDLKDYRSELANASTSCGSMSLLASLNSTAFQFDDVQRVRYSIFGSCGAFYEFLQSECQDQTRDGAVVVDLDTNEEASGSGCTPGTDTLPDGDWFGYVAAAGTTDLEFDLACWFTGIAAADAAAEDGEESPPPNDYYIRNVSDELRTVPVGDAVEVTALTTPGGPDTTTLSYDEWSAAWASREYQPGVWLTISDDLVVAITEQYQP